MIIIIDMQTILPCFSGLHAPHRTGSVYHINTLSVYQFYALILYGKSLPFSHKIPFYLIIQFMDSNIYTML